MNKTLMTYNTLARYPFGKRIFSFLVCRRARYFGTIKPVFESLQEGYCSVSMKFRKAITNHLGTVHAVAMCNLVELIGGICVDVSVPAGIRWIPKGMTVEYLALGKSSLKGICSFDVEKIKNWNLNDEFPATVNLYDVSGNIVMRGTIHIHLSKKH